ncbi:MAG: hypothetical protein QNJ07_13425 [Woeseiaceae bacterium]|nr:hypothetical protein [Woeseiaceae bacterium]
MKIPNIACLLILLSLSAYAEEQLQFVDLGSGAGEVLDDGTIRIAAGATPYQLLFELEDPGITAPVYALKGMVRHEGVEGDAYLQMDNAFAERGTFFTKTLATGGPLKKLTGNSDWRPFTLPFYANTGDQAGADVLTPQKLSVGLFLPGAGTVFVRDVALYQYAAGEDPLQASGQWFSNRTMALVGAIGGSLIGVWSGLIGFLASRGKARGFVLGSATVLIVLGVATFAIGTIVLATGQPYAVFYPLLLLGGIIIFVYGILRRVLPKRYEAIEMQKMHAMDA